MSKIRSVWIWLHIVRSHTIVDSTDIDHTYHCGIYTPEEIVKNAFQPKCECFLPQIPLNDLQVLNMDSNNWLNTSIIEHCSRKCEFANYTFPVGTLFQQSALKLFTMMSGIDSDQILMWSKGSLPIKRCLCYKCRINKAKISDACMCECHCMYSGPPNPFSQKAQSEDDDMDPCVWSNPFEIIKYALFYNSRKSNLTNFSHFILTQ